MNEINLVIWCLDYCEEIYKCCDFGVFFFMFYEYLISIYMFYRIRFKIGRVIFYEVFIWKICYIFVSYNNYL